MKEGSVVEARVRARSAAQRVLVQFHLRPEEAGRLRELSVRRDVPVTVIMREFVQRLLQEAEL